MVLSGVLIVSGKQIRPGVAYIMKSRIGGRSHFVVVLWFNDEWLLVQRTCPFRTYKPKLLPIAALKDYVFS